MRRFPKQARSQAKVEAIIASATAHLRDFGYEGMSTAEIAKSANVSVGTLYQFFDNKDDLMQAIAEKHVEKMQQFRAELFGTDAIYVPPEILVGRTVDWFVNYNLEAPTFNNIFNGAWSDPTMLATLHEITEGIITDLGRILRFHAKEDGDETHLYNGATLLVHTLKGTLPMLETAPPQSRPALLAEIKRLLLLYFTDITKRQL